MSCLVVLNCCLGTVARVTPSTSPAFFFFFDQFSPDQPVNASQTVGYMKRPSLREKIHCVAFVLDASKISSYPKSLSSSFQQLREHISDLGENRTAAQHPRLSVTADGSDGSSLGGVSSPSIFQISRYRPHRSPSGGSADTRRPSLSGNSQRCHPGLQQPRRPKRGQFRRTRSQRVSSLFSRLRDFDLCNCLVRCVQINAAAAVLGMSTSYIIPVKNYSSELEVNVNTDVLLLSAVDHILQYADLYFHDNSPPNHFEEA